MSQPWINYELTILNHYQSWIEHELTTIYHYQPWLTILTYSEPVQLSHPQSAPKAHVAKGWTEGLDAMKNAQRLSILSGNLRF